MYEFNNKMGKISGTGEPHESICRAMLQAGLEYRDQHPSAIQKIDNYDNLKDFYEATDSEIVGLREELIEGTSGEKTAPMVIAVLDHLKYVDKHGWDEYVEMMEAQAD